MKRLEVQIGVRQDDFSLDVAFTTHHPITGVFGPSGAGKTTLLEAVAGLRRQVTGHIRLGTEVWLDSGRGIDRRPEQRGVGYVPQDGLLFPHLDVGGNLAAGRRRAPDGEARRAEVVELLELAPLLDRMPNTLSGGERQRVALARALCSAPDLLLVDEPFASLDLPRRRRSLALLRSVRRELVVPMLFISHDPVEVQALCDDVVVLGGGRIVASGPPAEVLAESEVLPLAEGGGYINVLPVETTAMDVGAPRVRLLPAGPELTVEPVPAAGGEAILELAADGILIATEPPRGLSARNTLPARVTRVRRAAETTLVDAALESGGHTLVVEVTAATPDRLGLEPGLPVHLVIKATSCRLHGVGRRAPGV